MMNLTISRNFFKMPNAIFEYNLSGNAFLIYAWLASKPQNWTIIKNVIQIDLQLGKTAFQTGWNELKDKKFLVYKGRKIENGKFIDLKDKFGKFTHSYDFNLLPFENLEGENNITSSLKKDKKAPKNNLSPVIGNQSTMIPSSDIPIPENKVITNTETIKTDIKETNKNIYLTKPENELFGMSFTSNPQIEEGEIDNELKTWMDIADANTIQVGKNSNQAAFGSGQNVAQSGSRKSTKANSFYCLTDPKLINIINEVVGSSEYFPEYLTWILGKVENENVKPLNFILKSYQKFVETHRTKVLALQQARVNAISAEQSSKFKEYKKVYNPYDAMTLSPEELKLKAEKSKSDEK